MPPSFLASEDLSGCYSRCGSRRESREIRVRLCRSMRDGTRGLDKAVFAHMPAWLCGAVNETLLSIGQRSSVAGRPLSRPYLPEALGSLRPSLALMAAIGPVTARAGGEPL